MVENLHSLRSGWWAAAVTLTTETVFAGAGLGVAWTAHSAHYTDGRLTESAAGAVLGAFGAVPLAVFLCSVGAPGALLTVLAARWSATRYRRPDTWQWCLAVHGVLSVLAALCFGGLYVIAYPPAGPAPFAWWAAAHAAVLAAPVLVARTAEARRRHGRGYCRVLGLVAGAAALALAAETVAFLAYGLARR
ncbi:MULTISPECIES: hypothetical protein [Streptomyces]|uniref:Integral membrane protein n=1 Tax=Streptomyces luteosporeus TaxID=173856 RepID=A0ABP6GB79_9ACTN